MLEGIRVSGVIVEHASRLRLQGADFPIAFEGNAIAGRPHPVPLARSFPTSQRGRIGEN